MSRTKAKTTVTPAAAQAVVRPKRQRSNSKSPMQPHQVTRKWHDLTIQVSRVRKRTSNQSKVEARGTSRSHRAGLRNRATTNITIRQGRGSASSGSSDPTDTYGSGSSGSARVSQDSSASTPSSPPKHEQSHSSQGYKHKSKDNAEENPIPTPKPGRKTPKKKIIVAESFTEFRVPRGTRDVRIVIEEYGSVSTSPRTTRSHGRQVQPKQRKRSFTWTKTGRVIKSDQTLPMLSPRSLRRARLRVLDKTRKWSSSSSGSLKSLLADARRESSLLPRQHYCEPGVRGHYDTSGSQQTETQIYKARSGSPDPGSPHPGSGSASPEHEKKKVPYKPRNRIANMGVTEIMHLVANQSYHHAFAPTSILHKLDLDDATRAKVKEILRRRHGITATGIGPWNRVEKCRNRLEWSTWCCLYRSPESIENDEVPLAGHNRMSSFHSNFGPVLPQEDRILVPLTNAQAELLQNRLRATDKEGQ